MVTIKKESIEYTQKEMRKELKTFHHTHRKLNTKESNAEMRDKETTGEYKNKTAQ